jgi:hypothetical protein
MHLRVDDDEPTAREENVPPAKFLGQTLGCEITLEDSPAGAVIDEAFLPLPLLAVGPDRGVCNDKFRADPASLNEKAQPLRLLKVAIEMARKNTLKGAIPKGEGERIASYVGRVRCLASRDFKHSLAVVEPDHLAAQVPSQEARATGDVESPGGTKRTEQAFELV